MRVFVRSFGACLGFAAVAAVSLPVLLLLGGPLFGTATVLAFYMVAVASTYVSWIAPSRRLALLGGAGTLLGGLMLCLLVPGSGAYSLTLLAIGCAGSVSLARTGVFYGARRARALALELVLTVGGLWLARFLGGPGMLAMAAAMWGYLLVQSFYAIAPGLKTRRGSGTGVDGFERARARLDRLLEEVA